MFASQKVFHTFLGLLADDVPVLFFKETIKPCKIGSLKLHLTAQKNYLGVIFSLRNSLSKLFVSNTTINRKK